MDSFWKNELQDRWMMERACAHIRAMLLRRNRFKDQPAYSDLQSGLCRLKMVEDQLKKGIDQC